MSANPELDPARFATRRARPRGFEQAFVQEGRGGAPLVLIHGWPATRRIWWRNVEPLVASGFEVIAPDLRGFGDSEVGPNDPCDVAAHSRDLRALVYDHLGHRGVTVVGEDVGGAIALDLSLRFPGFVERLVLSGLALRELAGAGEGAMECPATRRRSVGALYTARGWACEGAFSPAAADFMSEPFADALRLRAGLRLHAVAPGPTTPRAHPGSGRHPTPTTILVGAEDPTATAELAREAKRRFPDLDGPRRVEGAARFLPWEAPDALHAAIRARGPRERAPAGAEPAFVSMGSNLGDRAATLCAAVAALRATPGVWDVVASPIYETDPVGPGPQGPYLNGVVRLETSLAPRALLARLLEIELEQGRTRGEVRNAARTLDLDLLLQGERRDSGPELVLPHPRMCERPFVLEPLRDLAPELVHPIAGETVEKLAARVRDPRAVRPLEPDTG